MSRILIALGISLALNLGISGSAVAQTAEDILNDFDYAKVATAVDAGANTPDSAPTAGYANGEFLHDQVLTQRWAIAGILLLAAISLIIILIFLCRRNATARDLVHGSGLVVIVYGTILLAIIVGESQQLTASMGILGAIAGYLFGAIQKQAETRGVTPGVTPAAPS